VTRARFDDQAERFDRRAGLPDSACQAVAQAVLDMPGLARGGRLLEVGAGTGQIGQYLHRSPLCYVGFDISVPMLHVFGRRVAAAGGQPALIAADGVRPWPLASGSVDVIFSSRTLHLLDCRRVVGEVFRVAAKRGAALLIGRVRRLPGTVQSDMRRAMLRLLGESGVEGKRAEPRGKELLDHCQARGAEPLPAVTVATWQVEHTPLTSIESWRGKPGLGGVAVSSQLKRSILQRLEAWALKRYGDLQRPVIAEEAYCLQGASIPDAAMRQEARQVNRSDRTGPPPTCQLDQEGSP